MFLKTGTKTYIEDNVRVTIVELSIFILWPFSDLEFLKQIESAKELVQHQTNISMSCPFGQYNITF